MDEFNKTFAIPIEKEGNAQERRDLKRLIQPFILRRTKVQILEKMLPRTEILLDIDLSKEEMVFYEALYHQQTLVRLSNDDESRGGQKHLKIKFKKSVWTVDAQMGFVNCSNLFDYNFVKGVCSIT